MQKPFIKKYSFARLLLTAAVARTIRVRGDKVFVKPVTASSAIALSSSSAKYFESSVATAFTTATPLRVAVPYETSLTPNLYGYLGQDVAQMYESPLTFEGKSSDRENKNVGVNEDITLVQTTGLATVEVLITCVHYVPSTVGDVTLVGTVRTSPQIHDFIDLG